MKRIYTSVDIGSDTIKVVVCELYKNKLNLLAATSEKSFGIKKGLITDVELVKSSLIKAFNQINDMLGIEVTEVIATIPSYFTDFSIVTGKKKILNENGQIRSKDIVDVIENSYSDFNDSGREILTVLPIDFKIDGEIVLDPKGMNGNLLQVRGILITLPKKNVYSVTSILASIGIKVVDISLGGLSDYNAFRTRETDLKAGAIVNIGSETTDISLFNKGIMVKNSIIGLGGRDISNDIAYIYKLSLEDAKKVKEKLALSDKKYASSNETFEIINKLGENVIIKQSELSEIVNSRLEQILNLVKNEVNGLANREIDYIIVSGGTSNIPYLNETMVAILGKKTSIGDMHTIGIRNSKYSSCLGNIIYFIQKIKIKGQDYTMVNEEDADILSSPRKNNINETNVLKALIGFFDE